MAQDTTTTAPLVDSKGTEIKKGYRITTAEGHKAHVGRVDLRSRRVVVIFEEVDGVKPLNDTMRMAHKVTVRKVAGKILEVKPAAAKPAPAKAKAADAPAKDAAARVKGKGKKAAAKPAAEPAAAQVVTADEPAPVDLDAIEVELGDDLASDLPEDAFQV